MIAGFAEELDCAASYDENVRPQLGVPWQAVAMRFEWYYDGRDAPWDAMGYLYPGCTDAKTYAGTDLVKLGDDLGVESDVTFDDKSIEWGGLTVGHAIAPEFDVYQLLEGFYGHQHVDGFFFDIETAYAHAFHLQMYRFLHAAYARLTRPPRHLFVGSHERWPVLVGCAA